MIKKSCSTNYLLINLNGDGKYPVGTTNEYCGRLKPKEITSISNSVKILFNNQGKKKASFQIYYSVV